MGWKLALNVLYTIGIFLCVMVGYWGYQHTRYEFIMGAVFIGALLVIFKVKLLKELRPPR